MGYCPSSLFVLSICHVRILETKIALEYWRILVKTIRAQVGHSLFCNSPAYIQFCLQYLCLASYPHKFWSHLSIVYLSLYILVMAWITNHYEHESYEVCFETVLGRFLCGQSSCMGCSKWSSPRWSLMIICCKLKQQCSLLLSCM